MEENTLQLDTSLVRRMLSWAKEAFAVDSPWDSGTLDDEDWDDWETEIL